MAYPAPCVFADDAYLIAAYPGVVVRAPETWAVAVLDAQAGEYAVSLGASQFAVVAADPPTWPEVSATVPAVADGLLTALGGSVLVAVAPSGDDAVIVQATGTAALDLTVAGPADDTIAATLVSGGDTNAAQRALWLERAKCGLPPCCAFGCCLADFTAMHAALAAHLLYVFGNLSGAGGAAGNFQSMRLGPASLAKGKSEWSGNPADTFLDTTAPGQYYLMLRSRYVMGIFCA